MKKRIDKILSNEYLLRDVAYDDRINLFFIGESINILSEQLFIQEELKHFDIFIRSIESSLMK